MTKKISQSNLRIRRHRRIRAAMSGTAQRPRIAVFKSSKHTYAQAIDDQKHVTLASVSDARVKVGKTSEAREGAGNKEKHAFALGQALGAKLKELSVGTVVFDRGGFQYHGRVKAVADGLRQAGITV
jgi:large subunit ribosomal protein L18